MAFEMSPSFGRDQRLRYTYKQFWSANLEQETAATHEGNRVVLCFFLSENLKLWTVIDTKRL